MNQASGRDFFKLHLCPHLSQLHSVILEIRRNGRSRRMKKYWELGKWRDKWKAEVVICHWKIRTKPVHQFCVGMGWTNPMTTDRINMKAYGRQKSLGRKWEEMSTAWEVKVPVNCRLPLLFDIHWIGQWVHGQYLKGFCTEPGWNVLIHKWSHF